MPSMNDETYETTADQSVGCSSLGLCRLSVALLCGPRCCSGGNCGGLTGAALGDRGDNAVGGALIGTAVGALTGAAIGDSMDAELDRRQALIEAKTGRRMAGEVTTSDV